MKKIVKPEMQKTLDLELCKKYEEKTFPHISERTFLKKELKCAEKSFLHVLKSVEKFFPHVLCIYEPGSDFFLMVF